MCNKSSVWFRNFDCAVIELAGCLITFQVSIDPHDDSFCFWPILALLFLAYGGRCRFEAVLFHLVRLL
jgi:hypothetical protein